MVRVSPRRRVLLLNEFNADFNNQRFISNGIKSQTTTNRTTAEISLRPQIVFTDDHLIISRLLAPVVLQKRVIKPCLISNSLQLLFIHEEEQVDR